jgi:hypothetical protein
MPDQRRRRYWAYLAATVVGALVISQAPLVLVGRPVVHGVIDAGRVVVWTIAVALAMVWAVGFGVLMFRNQDEFQRQASQVGWYWGATLGIGLSTPIFVFIGLGGLHAFWPGVPASPELKRAFVIGYLLPVLMQFAGFLIVRAGWRWSKR